MGLILVDSSVWIDALQTRHTRQTDVIRQSSAARQRLVIGDLVLAEVLQGTRDERRFEAAQAFFADFQPIIISDHRVAVMAARHYQILRARGITVRKTIDTLIATRCILDNIPLLYGDRDFDPFVEHLGLRSALDPERMN